MKGGGVWDPQRRQWWRRWGIIERSKQWSCPQGERWRRRGNYSKCPEAPTYSICARVCVCVCVVFAELGNWLWSLMLKHHNRPSDGRQETDHICFSLSALLSSPFTSPQPSLPLFLFLPLCSSPLQSPVLRCDLISAAWRSMPPVAGGSIALNYGFISPPHSDQSCNLPPTHTHTPPPLTTRRSDQYLTI